MAVEDIEKFILSKSDWLDKKIKKNLTVNAEHFDIINYRSVLISGKAVPLTIGEKNIVSAEGVVVKSLDDIKKVYLKYFQESFLNKYNKICDIINLRASEVKIRDYKSRWGCCDSKNKIIFNYKLMMLPQRLQTYVIVHELCHIVHHNHSQEFWNEVKKYLPDFKLLRNELKTYSYLNTIYA
jgi:hypothetical protein